MHFPIAPTIPIDRMDVHLLGGTGGADFRDSVRLAQKLDPPRRCHQSVIRADDLSRLFFAPDEVSSPALITFRFARPSYTNIPSPSRYGQKNRPGDGLLKFHRRLTPSVPKTIPLLRSVAGAQWQLAIYSMLAWAYSRFNLAMKSTLISLGQTASHSY